MIPERDKRKSTKHSADLCYTAVFAVGQQVTPKAKRATWITNKEVLPWANRLSLSTGEDVITTLQIIGLVALGVVVLVVLLVVVSKLVLQGMKGPLEARIAAQFGSDGILMKDLTANSFGLESAGAWQVRGNGALVLTAKSLDFFMFLPKRDLRVPLDAITDVTLTKSHLGKATIYNLLKVRFSADGKSDSIAWYLRDAAAWKNRIEKLKADSAAAVTTGDLDRT
jgi:hypothetical protein